MYKIIPAFFDNEETKYRIVKYKKEKIVYNEIVPTLEEANKRVWYLKKKD